MCTLSAGWGDIQEAVHVNSCLASWWVWRCCACCISYPVSLYKTNLLSARLKLIVSDPVTPFGGGTVVPYVNTVKLLKIKYKREFLKEGREMVLSSKDQQLVWQSTSQWSNGNQKIVEQDYQCLKENTCQSEVLYGVNISKGKVK